MQTAAAGGAVSPSGAVQATAEIEQLLAKGNSKLAVELAKTAYKRSPNADSERLLVTAYAARIASMEKHGMHPEAKALFDMVWERYPGARNKLTEVRHTVAEGSLDDLVRPLNDPSLAPEERARIESAISRKVTNPADLANCAALLPDHPLRLAAAALRNAFYAVTSGHVEDSALDLAEVSRRGPLAAWKTLVRAIAAFYRRDDENCERLLQSIQPESPCARLIPVLRASISGQPPGGLKPAASTLAVQVGGSWQTLRTALENLDSAIEDEHPKTIVDAGRAAMKACRESAPDLAARLQQEIASRLIPLDLRDDQLLKATDGPPRMDARYWFRGARMLEGGPPMASAMSATLWEHFREAAIHEGWFARDKVEDAVLLLHMAELLKEVPDDILADFRKSFKKNMRDYDGFDPDLPRSAREVESLADAHLYSGSLYSLACEIDPHTEAFEKWLDWAKRQSEKKRAEEVLETWRRALPAELRPVLLLLKSAEERKAFKKALDLLDEAERIDSLNPEVRRARMRLLVGGAMRHLGQNKSHLAESELQRLEALPEAKEKDRPAFLAALRWISHALEGEVDNASKQFSILAGTLGGDLAASLLIAEIARGCGISNVAALGLPATPKPAPSESAFTAVARVCAVGDDMGIEIEIPQDLETHIVKELSAKDRKWHADQLRALAEAALRRNRSKLAYAVTAAGLALGGDTDARFLFLRARTIEQNVSRRFDCLAAAAELARRQRDIALLEQIVELRRRDAGMDDIDREDLSANPDELKRVLAFERTAKFRAGSNRRVPGVCNCPDCRARRAGRQPDFGRMGPDLGSFLEELEALFGGKRGKPSPQSPNRGQTKPKPKPKPNDPGLFDFEPL